MQDAVTNSNIAVGNGSQRGVKMKGLVAQPIIQPKISGAPITNYDLFMLGNDVSGMQPALPAMTLEKLKGDLCNMAALYVSSFEVISL